MSVLIKQRRTRLSVIHNSDAKLLHNTDTVLTKA